MKARTWLVSVTTSTAVAVALTGGASLLSVSKLIESHSMLAGSRDIIQKLEHLLYRLADANAAERAYIITGQDGFLDAYRETTTDLNAVLKELRPSLQGDPEQLSRYNKLVGLLREHLSNLDVNIEIFKSKGQEASLERLRQSTELTFRRQSREIIDEMQKDEMDTLTKRVEAVQKMAESTEFTVAYGTLFAVLFILLMNLLLRQRIINRVDRLLKASANIQHGRFDTIINSDTNDEFSDLAESFNMLGQKLQYFSDAKSQDQNQIDGLKKTIDDNERAILQLNEKIREISWLAKEEILESLNLQETATALIESIEKISDSRNGLERKSHTASEFAQRLRNGSDNFSSNCAELSLKLNIAFDKSEQTSLCTKGLGELSDDIHELSASFEQMYVLLERVANESQSQSNSADLALRLREIADQARTNKQKSEKAISKLSHQVSNSISGSDEVRAQLLALKLSADQLADLTKRFPEMQSKLQAAVADISATSRLHGSILLTGRSHVEALLKLAERASTQIKRISLKTAESEELTTKSEREFAKPN